MQMRVRAPSQRSPSRSCEGQIRSRRISVSSDTDVLRRAASTTRLSHVDSVSSCRCAASFTRTLTSGETRVLITGDVITGHSVTHQAPASYPAYRLKSHQNSKNFHSLSVFRVSDITFRVQIMAPTLDSEVPLPPGPRPAESLADALVSTQNGGEGRRSDVIRTRRISTPLSKLGTNMSLQIVVFA